MEEGVSLGGDSNLSGTSHSPQKLNFVDWMAMKIVPDYVSGTISRRRHKKRGAKKDVDLSKLTLKELDYWRLVKQGKAHSLVLGEKMKQKFMLQLDKDLELLKKFGFMDYS
jgi:hypothetical protein